jgi:hypothetical protein
MPRVAKSDHAQIRLMVEVEQRKVPDVAAQYGCTPANIYAILKRMKAGEGEAAAVAAETAEVAAAPVVEAGPEAAKPVPAATASIVDLFSVATAPSPDATSEMPPRVDRASPARPVAKSGGGGSGKLLKPGFGFHMRTAEGEESVMPFRSLEDLLSAAKGILRGAAKSPEPVWFSIQSLDLSTIDADAA